MQAEQERVREIMAKTTCRSFSSYIRKIIFDEPVTVYYRNKSYDDFTEAYVSFKRDLDVILGKGFLTETEKEWLYKEIIIIKETVSKLYDYVRENRTDETSFKRT